MSDHGGELRLDGPGGDNRPVCTPRITRPAELSVWTDGSNAPRLGGVADLDDTLVEECVHVWLATNAFLTARTGGAAYRGETFDKLMRRHGIAWEPGNKLWYAYERETRRRIYERELCPLPRHNLGTYKHMTAGDEREIEDLFWGGLSRTDIAKQTGRSYGLVCKVIRVAIARADDDRAA